MNLSRLQGIRLQNQVDNIFKLKKSYLWVAFPLSKTKPREFTALGVFVSNPQTRLEDQNIDEF